MQRVPSAWSNRRNNISRYRDAVRTIRRLNQAVDDGHSEIRLDLSDVSWVSSVYSAPLATAIQGIRTSGVSIEITPPSSSKVASYLQTIGFPEGMKEPIKGNVTYLPLLRLNTPGEKSALDTANNTLRNLIQKLIGDSIDINIDGISYPIGELLDNVDQHSQCDHGFAMVQYYRKKKRLELCIVDDGISIPGNFEHHGIEFESDTEAVRRAVTEGLSTKAEQDAKGRQRGTGFRTTSKIICRGLKGEFLVSSREGAIQRQTELTEVSRCSWDGTVIFGSLNVPRSDFDLYKYITG